MSLIVIHYRRRVFQGSASPSLRADFLGHRSSSITVMFFTLYIRVEQIVFIDIIVRALFTTQQIWIDTFRKDKVSCLFSFPFSIPSTYRSCCFKAVVPPSIHNDFRGASRRWTMRRAMRVSPPQWFRRPCLWVNKRYFRSMYSTNLFIFLLTLLNSQYFLVFIPCDDFTELRVFVSF